MKTCDREKQGAENLQMGTAQECRLQQRSVSGAMLLLLGTVLLGILTVGNAFVLDAVIGQFRLVWLAVMACFEVASIAAAMILWPNLRPAVRWHWPEMVGMLVVGGAFLAHALYLAPSDLMPISFSVDCSHQHLLVNYIYEHNRFPDGVHYLYIYDDYPVGPSALAALLARLLAVLPVQTMVPLAALFVAAQAMVVYGVSAESLPRRPSSHILAVLAALVVFLAYPFSVNVFTERFYSNMMMGDLTVLLALWVTVVRERLHPVWTAGLTVCLIFGCLNSYPAWLPFTATPLVVSTLLDRRISVRKRWLLVGTELIVTAILTVVTVIDQWDFITWFAPSRGRRLIPDWQSLGGIALIFLGWGTWTLVRTWKRHRGLALFIVTDTVLVIALYGMAILDRLTLYIPDKTFYFNVFLFSVPIALGLSQIWERLAPASRIKDWVSCIVMATLGLVVVAGVNSRFHPPSEYPITLDEYRVAYRTAKEMPDAELVYLVRNNATFYWAYGCILNHTQDLAVQSERWQASPPTYEGWMQDVAAPSRAIVSDLRTLPQDGRWRIIIRSGNSGVIGKVH